VIPPERARRVRLLGLDVDGVLTDNAIWIAPIAGERVELKRFDVSDGLGLVILRYTDIAVALVSGRHSEATSLRAEELRIGTVIQDDGAKKLAAVEALLRSKGLSWNELAFVGDDLADLPILKRAGLPITVANGCPEAKVLAAWETRAAGGHGAVREVVEALLKARGEWDAVLARYLLDRGDPPA
jgi:3-deoxy-D-manno-octulosonate 8-phosphate phosphatase (KDO 8-P phosphatase)